MRFNSIISSFVIWTLTSCGYNGPGSEPRADEVSFATIRISELKQLTNRRDERDERRDTQVAIVVND